MKNVHISSNVFWYVYFLFLDLNLSNFQNFKGLKPKNILFLSPLRPILVQNVKILNNWFWFVLFNVFRALNKSSDCIMPLKKLFKPNTGWVVHSYQLFGFTSRPFKQVSRPFLNLSCDFLSLATIFLLLTVAAFSYTVSAKRYRIPWIFSIMCSFSSSIMANQHVSPPYCTLICLTS